jgi:site-specific recombinase XerD
MSQQLLVPVAPGKSVHNPRPTLDSPRFSSLAAPPRPHDGDLRACLDNFLCYLRDFRSCSPLTLAAYRRDAEDFIAFLEGDDVLSADQVDRPHAYRYAAALPSRGREGHLAPASIRRKLFALSSWFRYLGEMGVVRGNPFASVPLPKRPQKFVRVPDEDQCQALLSAARTTQERAMVALLLMAGLRRAELLGLNAEDIGGDCGEIRVTGKGGKERVVPLCAPARDALGTHLAERGTDSGALFVGRTGQRLRNTSLQRAFKRLLKQAGLEDEKITLHRLRHCFASFLVRAGADPATVAELLGHSSIATLSIYLHSDAASKQQAVSRLPWSRPDEVAGTSR